MSFMEGVGRGFGCGLSFIVFVIVIAGYAPFASYRFVFYLLYRLSLPFVNPRSVNFRNYFCAQVQSGR